MLEASNIKQVATVICVVSSTPVYRAQVTNSYYIQIFNSIRIRLLLVQILPRCMVISLCILQLLFAYNYHRVLVSVLNTFVIYRSELFKRVVLTCRRHHIQQKWFWQEIRGGGHRLLNGIQYDTYLLSLNHAVAVSIC